MCSEHEFKCKNEQCINWDRVCNGQKDGCTDESDEGGNCATACQISPCEQRCIRSPNGPVCACRDGYELNHDKKTCKDINECNNSPCQQLCVNTLGSFQCSCFTNFYLSSDKVSCEKNTDDMHMFYSAYDTIFRMQPHLTKLLTANGSKIIGLDIHIDKRLLYYTVEESDTLYVFDWTRKPNTVNSVKNIGKLSQVVVDWLTDNVYMIDDARAIIVCHLSGHCIKLIQSSKSEHITSLTIDAINRRLSYTTKYTFQFNRIQSTIYVHNLDGSRKQTITKDSFTIASMACDIDADRLFYVGLESKTIWSIKYDGTDKKLVIAQNEYLSKPSGINLYENHAYVSNDESNIIAKCQLSGDKNCMAIPLNVNQPDNLVIDQKVRQKSSKNMCENNKCNTICIPSTIGAKCICDFGVMVEAGIECNSVVSSVFLNWLSNKDLRDYDLF